MQHFSALFTVLYKRSLSNFLTDFPPLLLGIYADVLGI